MPSSAPGPIHALARRSPTWRVYESLLRFAAIVHRDQRDLERRDLIDVQSFIWVQGSDEYEE